MFSQQQKAEVFRALHQRKEAFLIPNPWDAGTARLLELAGFEALATTSGGFAFSQGLPDYGVTRQSVLDHIAAIAPLTNLPLSADLENGFGDTPAFCAETIKLAAQAGAVGGSIEDATGHADAPIYRIEVATERIRAAAEAAHSLDFPFQLTARAENYLNGRPDIADTIQRLQAFQEAGADVLFAPGITRREDIASVLASIDRPLNVIVVAGMELTVADFSAIGVRRISVGSSLARVAFGAFLRAAEEIKEHGTFEFTKEPLTYRALNELLARKS